MKKIVNLFTVGLGMYKGTFAPLFGDFKCFTVPKSRFIVWFSFKQLFGITFYQSYTYILVYKVENDIIIQLYRLL